MLYLFTGEFYLVLKNQHIWNKWAETLHRWGMREVAAIMMEAAEPLNFVGAQAVYLGQPFLNAIFPEDHVTALANLLDSPEDTKAFTHFLRDQKYED